MSVHGFVGAGFPRKTCAVCGQAPGHASHNVVSPDELAIERERSLARRREHIDEIRRVRIPLEEQRTKGGFPRRNRKQRGEG